MKKPSNVFIITLINSALANHANINSVANGPFSFPKNHNKKNSISVKSLAAYESYNLSRSRTISILVKTLPPQELFFDQS